MTARPETTTCYRVTYAAAGCLPDGDPVYFDSLEEACRLVVEEFDDIAADAEAHGATGDLPILTHFDIEVGVPVANPLPSSTYAWAIEALERVEEPTNAYLGWVCGNCIGHLANGECGDCPHESGRDPLSLFEYGQHVTCGMFAIHHADDCPAHYGERDVECDCEVVDFSHDRCDGCGELPGDRHAVTVLVEASTNA